MAFLYLIGLTMFWAAIGGARAQSNGELRLYRNGDVSSNALSGRLQIYLDDTWGNVCDTGFGMTEATVACQQLTYNGATSFDSAETDEFGDDGGPTHISQVTCGTSNALHILQCDFANDSICPPENQVSISCNSEPIWSNPRDFQVRLQDGEYHSSGRVEYYLSTGWTSICSEYFDGTAAQVVCRQLGYTEAMAFNTLRLSSSNEPLLNSFTCCSGASCFDECLCTIPLYEFCENEFDATVQCNFVVTEAEIAGERFGCESASSSQTLAIVLGTISGVLATIVIIVVTVAGMYIQSKKEG